MDEVDDYRTEVYLRSRVRLIGDRLYKSSCMEKYQEMSGRVVLIDPDTGEELSLEGIAYIPDDAIDFITKWRQD